MPKENHIWGTKQAPDSSHCSIINRLAEELNFTNLPAGHHTLMLLPPLHNGKLNSFITIDRHKVAVLVPIPKPHGLSPDRPVRESGKLGIHTVDQRPIQDVACDDERHVILVKANFGL